MLELVEGQYYVMRNQEIVGPMQRHNDAPYVWRAREQGSGTVRTFCDDGCYYSTRSRSMYDIISVRREASLHADGRPRMMDEFGLPFWQKAYANYLRKQKPWTDEDPVKKKI